VTLTKHDSDSELTLDSEQNKKCHKASCVGIMLLRLQCLRLNAGTMSLLFVFGLLSALVFSRIWMHYSDWIQYE